MIKLTGVNVELRRFALRYINLAVEDGDYFMLVGPTGSGKTLLLDTIAGLHRVKKGEILIDDTDITSLEPEKRNIGVVYQDSALFPHLSVADNIVYGLKIRHISRAEMKAALKEAASLVKIEHLLDRKPVKLSGGEKQKVALARALAIKPRVLLLDEPLSAFDPETREGLQLELKRIHRQLGVTIIHVTHDFDEALMLGKHLAVIGEGKIRQTGTPEEIFRRPNSIFVARFTMMRNILPGRPAAADENNRNFLSGDIKLALAAPFKAAEFACIRPDDITVSTGLPAFDSPNSFSGTVSRIEERGMSAHVYVNIPPEVCCLISRNRLKELGLYVGQTVIISFKPDSVHVF